MSTGLNVTFAIVRGSPPWAQAKSKVHSTYIISVFCEREKHGQFWRYSGRYRWTIFSFLFGVELQSTAACLLMAQCCESTISKVLVDQGKQFPVLTGYFPLPTSVCDCVHCDCDFVFFITFCKRMHDWFIKRKTFQSWLGIFPCLCDCLRHGFICLFSGPFFVYWNFGPCP